ncbi:hypothetical protein V3C99_001204, partial [Haemonchus contortus]
MEELAISDRVLTAPALDSEEVSGAGEVDDLENSLLKVSLIYGEENQPEDSFDEPPTFKSPIVKRSPAILRSQKISCMKSNAPRSPLVERNLNSTPDQRHPSIKRARQPVLAKSPSTASPLLKNLRVERLPPSTAPSTDLDINDVCRTESAWNYFVQRSSLWNKVGVALVKERSSASATKVTGICLCPTDGWPHFIPLTEEYFPGNEEEEAICPSSTPSQSITLDERVSCVASIMQSCELFLFDALRDCHVLRKSFELKNIRVKSVSYMAFLGHLRQGDRVQSLSEIAAKFQWSFDYASLLRMNPRIACGAQAYLASRLVDILTPIVISCSSSESLHLELRSLQAVNAMCLGGFCFDRALCSSLIQRLKKNVEQLESDCFSLIGHQFNLDSSKQVSEVLFSRLKLTCPGGSSTKKHLSTSKAILEQMERQHPVVSNILRYRRLKHALTQCLIPMQHFVDGDGMVRSHCDMNTSTGRILCVEPSVQTVPKDEVLDGIGLRHLFRAQQDCVLISADYCQLELRVLAHLSEDPALLQVFKGGQDVFADMSLLLGISRDTTKKLCYGVIYGMGAKTLGETVKKSVNEANELIKNFFQSFPRVRTFINNTKDKAVKAGFVTTVLGRRRVTCSTRGRQEDVARDDRQSINYVIQGTASEIFKRAIVALDEGRKGTTRLVMTIHD